MDKETEFQHLVYERTDWVSRSDELTGLAYDLVSMLDGWIGSAGELEDELEFLEDEEADDPKVQLQEWVREAIRLRHHLEKLIEHTPNDE